MTDIKDQKLYNKGTFAELEALCQCGDEALNIPPEGKVNYRNGQLDPNAQRTMECMGLWQNPEPGKEDQYLTNPGQFLTDDLTKLSYNEALAEGWFAGTLEAKE